MIKDLVWIYNSVLYSLITYFIPCCDSALYLSYSRFNQFIGQLCGFRVFVYGDDFNPDEKSLIVCNHKAMYDVLSMFYVSGHFNRIIGFCLKKQVSQMPGPGWWCRRMKFPTLNRDISDLKMLEKVAAPFPIVIYPEGTRFSNNKYIDCCEYAKRNGYSISKYAQLPKYKGAFALTNKIVYQMTLVYFDKNNRIITGEMNGFPSSVYIHVKKYIDVPTNETAYKSWIQTQFKNIDDIYDNFMPNNAVEMKPNYKLYDYPLYLGYLAINLLLVYKLIF